MASIDVVDPAEPGVIDGRLARSARTRLAIVDALRSLHHDGDLVPTAPRVAERAGVSLRTVWQHFDDLESLLAAAGRRDFDIAQTFLRPIDVGQPVADRIDALLAQRVAMYEEMAPVWRAARLKTPFSPQLRANRDRLLALGRAQLEEVFGPELDRTADRRALLVALEAATSWASWEMLRAELDHPAAATRAAVRLTVNRLLSDPA